MSLLIKNGVIVDTRSPDDIIFNGDFGVAYTLLTDDITKGKKPWGTPYIDRLDIFAPNDDGWYAPDTGTNITATRYEDGLRFDMKTDRCGISEYGAYLPINFMGKFDGGGWTNQFLFNSPYTSPDKSIIYFYLSKPNGNNLAVAIVGGADGWKMDYSTYLWSHYFVGLKLLSNYDRAYGTPDREKKLSFVLLPVADFPDCLNKMSRLYGVPFLDYDIGGGKIGGGVSLIPYGEPDHILEKYNGSSRLIPFDTRYTVHNDGETVITPIKNGKMGAEVTLYGYNSMYELYKKSMRSVDLDIIDSRTNSNLCEHQCWASATLRFLMRYGDRVDAQTIHECEERLKILLNIMTEKDEARAIEKRTILNRPHGRFPAYNVYRSERVQELAFAITILLDAYKYFGNEEYYTYAIGATDTLTSHYMREDGCIEVDWGDNCEDYTTVCCPLIPIADMALFIKERDPVKASKYRHSIDKIAEYLYHRGMHFPTEGGKSDKAEAEMEDGSISCTALSLLYYCKNIRRDEKYIKKAKDILDVHDSWIIRTPICQMHGSSLRWWETQWEGDADGPAICAGHAWSIWRAEADYLYYALTNDVCYLYKAKNGFMTNLSKIDKEGNSYAIYNPDEINGGGFHSDASGTVFRIAKRFPSYYDCGLSRYVWIRINDTELINE